MTRRRKEGLECKRREVRWVGERGHKHKEIVRDDKNPPKELNAVFVIRSARGIYRVRGRYEAVWIFDSGYGFERGLHVTWERGRGRAAGRERDRWVE